jgi:cytochrome b561
MPNSRPESIQLNRALRYCLYIVLALLFFSGAGWAYWNYLVAHSGDFEASAKTWAMKIHGAAAMAILVLIGALLTGHVKVAWRARRNRGNGALLLGVFGILIITGYGLYYAGGEELRAWTSWIHLSVGLSIPILIVLHVALGKKTRPANTPSQKTQSAKQRSDGSGSRRFQT